ncbi:MAG: hypothetical protein ACRD8U_16345, partial [Pyrinomonadaceae bacterium]
LVSWSYQAEALAEIAACVKPGGLYLTSEGWEEGMVGLNLRRRRVGLPPITVVEHNLLMSRICFEREAGKYFDFVGYIGAGLYLYMSRIFQPLFVLPNVPSHLHPINKLASGLQVLSFSEADFSDCDYAGVYVLRRKELVRES